MVSDPQYRRRSVYSVAVFLVPPARHSGCVPYEDMRAFPDGRRKSFARVAQGTDSESRKSHIDNVPGTKGLCLTAGSLFCDERIAEV